MATTRKLTVLGSGFAALTACKTLRKLNPQAEITLISPAAELIYLPSIIWIPAGLRQGADLRVNLNRFLAKQRITHLPARVQNVSQGGRLVTTDQGEFTNDGLIIASGGRFIKKLSGIEHAITPCEGIAAAEKIRDRLAQMSGGTIAIGFGTNPQETSAMRGGPMFEFLFGIDTLLRRQGRRDQFKLIFFNASAEPGKRLGDQVPQKIGAMMAKKGIESHLGHKIIGFEAQTVKTEGGEFHADFILFMPGMTGPAWLPDSDLPSSAGGMIQANAFAQVVGWPATYVAGDAGSFPGPDWQAKQAHAADLQAKTAAQNLTKELNGRTNLTAFKHELICIIDTLSHGILVKRTEQGTTLLPPCRLLHWAKRAFEGVYLRQYR
ncbi:MAG: FAD-dependent oxidoreductase [Thiotrichales bacterium]|nr:FAD-dependent oxidoreductase [Thiotrichales bacterium]